MQGSKAPGLRARGSKCKAGRLKLQDKTASDYNKEIPGKSIKGPDFEKYCLLLEYQSNNIETCLGLFPICPIRLSMLAGFNRPFLSFEMGDFL